MRQIPINSIPLTAGCSRLATVPEQVKACAGSDTLAASFLLSHEGAGFDLTFLKDIPERYVLLTLCADTENSLAFQLQAYSTLEPGDYVFDMQTGVLPGIPTQIVIDLEWLKAKELFPERAPGQLKITCHGRRVNREEIDRLLLVTLPRYEDVAVSVSDLTLTDDYPESFPVAPEKFVDELGQYKKKSWKGKFASGEEMVQALRSAAGELSGDYAQKDFTSWGGWQKQKLLPGSGFFSKTKKDGRWYLTDPEGYAFFSMGPDCVVIRSDCRIDDIETWMDWLPSENDPLYGSLYQGHPYRTGTDSRGRNCRMFSFEQANLIRAFGDGWYDAWKKMIASQLKSAGMNTIANWSDPALFGTSGIPYVTSLPEFPDTGIHIFRDFPDVLSPEYRESAERCAQGLIPRKDDPWMIGYFLRNEPAWAFVDNLVVADEVLFCPERSCCKEVLIERIRSTYGSVETLNKAWKLTLTSFDDLYEPHESLSRNSPEADAFLRAFSAELIREYVSVPANACRKADPNHMILGMRWAWISDPAIVSGWENFDVFSINCYAFDPTPAIDNVVRLGVDLPVMIGEFHFGALDAGPVSTGLKGVKTQKDRANAIRNYIEATAAHPYGVGCHYFQCYDQFALGRFDGENYNIGLFDICLQPYSDIMDGIRKTMKDACAVTAGLKEACNYPLEKAPVIAF